jgi:hypothetical protein
MHSKSRITLVFFCSAAVLLGGTAWSRKPAGGMVAGNSAGSAATDSPSSTVSAAGPGAQPPSSPAAPAQLPARQPPNGPPDCPTCVRPDEPGAPAVSCADQLGVLLKEVAALRELRISEEKQISQLQADLKTANDSIQELQRKLAPKG